MLPGTRNQNLGDVRSCLSSASKSVCGSGQASPTLQASVSPVVFKIPSSFVVLKHEGFQTSKEATEHEQELLGDEVGKTVQSSTLQSLIPG